MRAAAVLSILVVFGTLVSADTYPRQPAVDAIHYRFAITLSENSPHIDGQATVTFRVVAPVEHIELDLIGAGTAETSAPGMRVTSVKVGQQTVTFAHARGRLKLEVPSGTAAGTDVTYTIQYGGVPTDGLKVFTNIHGERVVFSEGWPNRARHWLPMIDHPYDKATGEMIVTAPPQWQVVSNGVLVEETDLNATQRRTHWKQAVPIASWLYAVGVARFTAHHAGTVQGVPLQTWSFPQDGRTARDLFEETSRRAMQFFSERVGPYPYEKLANVQASGFGGGMENATVIFYGEKGVASGRGPVVHEVAHQWFGNSVTERDWDDVWLSEGFASYFTHLYREHFDGRDAFAEGLQRSRAGVLETSKKLPDAPVIHRNLDDMTRVLNGLVYEKGAWVLHMLRAEIGTDAFWAGIRDYYGRYRDRNASTDDFRQVMEAAGGKDLRQFFTQWLHRGGNPRIDGKWRYDASRKVIVLSLTQTQPGETYLLPLDVEVTTGSERQTHRVSMNQKVTATELPAASAPSQVVLDPQTWLLAEFSLVKEGG